MVVTQYVLAGSEKDFIGTGMHFRACLAFRCAFMSETSFLATLLDKIGRALCLERIALTIVKKEGLVNGLF